MGSGAKVILRNGALASNVFWQTGTAAILGTTAHIEGTILAGAEITLATGATVNGRLLSQTAVTLQQNTINVAGGTNPFIAQPIVQKTFTSNPNNGYDGFITGNAGNTTGSSMNSNESTIEVGDTSQNRQSRGILDFDTSTLPANAVITGATVMMQTVEAVNSTAFSSLGSLLVDINQPYFGLSENLELIDALVAFLITLFTDSAAHQ